VHSHNTSNQDKIIGKGKVHSPSHLSIPSKVRHMLWLLSDEDRIEYVVNWDAEKLYIRKKRDIPYPDDDDEVLKEGKLMQNKDLSLPQLIRGMLWVQVGEKVEYVSDSSGVRKIHIRKKR
jgi:hypothetical protein